MSWRPRNFFSHSIRSARQLDAVNAQGGIAVDFRPVAREGTSITVIGGQSEKTSVWKTESRTGFITVPSADMDVLTIRFVTRGQMRRRDYRGDHVGDQDHAMMVVFREMREEEATRDFESLSGTISRAALVSAHLALQGPDAGPLHPFLPVVDGSTFPLQILRRSMDRVHGLMGLGIDDADLVFPLLEEVMVYQILTAWPREGAYTRPSTSAVAKPLDRAMGFIDANLSRKLQLSEVAEAAGIGVRRLQILFQRDIDQTPLQFILGRRLDRVHEDIRNAEGGASIGSIAHRWGFTHMGDFSRRYRERFGEAPSLTMKSRV